MGYVVRTSRDLSSECIPWLSYVIHAVSVYGFVPGLVDPHMGLRLLIAHFKCGSDRP